MSSQGEQQSSFLMPTRLVQSEWPPNPGLMSGDPHYDAMLESVQQEGIRNPLTMNLQWRLIDGQHRLAAARQIGITMVPVRVWTGIEFLP